jgi:hypothetical protein
MARTPCGPIGMVMVLVACAAMSACGSDGPAVCSSVDALQSSVAHLGDVNVSENGLASMQGALDQVTTDLKQLEADARAQYGPEIDTVKTSVAALRGSVETAKDDPHAETYRAVVSGVATLGTGLRTLREAVAGTC